MGTKVQENILVISMKYRNCKCLRTRIEYYRDGDRSIYTRDKHCTKHGTCEIYSLVKVIKKAR
jgi:hypothetical protein